MRLSPWVNLLSSLCTPDSRSVSAVLIGKWLSTGFLAGLLPMDQGNQMLQRRLCLWTCVRAVALEIQSGPGSHAIEELQEILAYVEHKALVPRKTHHTLDVASFPSQERWCIGWLSSDRILEKNQKKSFLLLLFLSGYWRFQAVVVWSYWFWSLARQGIMPEVCDRGRLSTSQEPGHREEWSPIISFKGMLHDDIILFH